MVYSQVRSEYTVITSNPDIRGLSPDLLEDLKESVKSIRVRAIKPR